MSRSGLEPPACSCSCCSPLLQIKRMWWQPTYCRCFRHTVLDNATTGAIYRGVYPALAAMDTELTFPLLGGCSQHPPCPVAPFGNEITHNVAVNMAPPTCA